MKKFLCLTLCLILSLTSQIFISCTPSDESEPEYNETYSFDDDFHWRDEIGGDGKVDLAKHIQNSGKCQVCDYYYDCPNLKFRQIEIDGVLGYECYGYDEFINPNYLNIKIPEYHKEASDNEPLPVIAIGDYAFCGNGAKPENYYDDKYPCKVKIRSVKIPNTVVKLGYYAFCHSEISELVIPDSVTSDLYYTAMYCSSLKRVVVGNGVQRIMKYVFCNSNLLEEVILGSSVREIRQRNFIGNPELKRIVLPASLVSIPESSYEGNAQGLEPQINLFKNSGNPEIYLEITKEQLQLLTIPKKTRDDNGNIIYPSTSTLTTYGFVEGWSGSSKLYFKGEWEYDSNGKPTPIN